MAMNMFSDICNTLYLFGIISNWCPSPVHPEEGTVLQSSCSGTTLIETIADGKGGSIQSLTGNSEQCGYTPPVPEAGTLLRSGCSKDYLGVKWFQYADGEGGTYVEKDRRSYECGFRRYLNLSMEKEYGDRFDPAIVKVDYKDMLGRPEGWGMADHSTTIGKAVRLDRDTVAIYGDGRTGDGIFTLGTTEIQFYIENEPVCEFIDEPNFFGSSTRTDCEGHTQKGGQELIYYGEDDNRLVTWELGVLVYASHSRHGDDLAEGILEELDETHREWTKWSERVETYNKVYERSGVHIRYKLTKLWSAHYHNLQGISNIITGKPVDVVLAYGISYEGTCGVAKVKTWFSEGKPPYSMSKCTTYTDLHEIGHSVGLAHGPENQGYPASGYIFPEFGHGYNDICGTKDDLMSYGYEGYFHSNSKLYCDEIFTGSWYEGILAGGTEFSDTAHALNRVRYNVSLIHKENDYVDTDTSSRLQRIESRAERKEIEVID